MEGLGEICGNLVGLADSTRNFEVLWICDEDDGETQEALAKCRVEFPSLRMRVFCKEQDLNLSDGYFNWVCRFGKPQGKLLWAAGNDVRMCTKGWDTGMLEGVEEYLEDKPDRICLAFARDRHQTDKGNLGFEWGCFPVLTREAVDALGWFFPKEFITWEADVAMATMFQRLGRLLMVDRVVIDQISYHAYPNVPRDAVAMSMKERHQIRGQASLRNWYRTEQMPRDVQRLREVIERGGVAEEEPVQ